jgi:cyanophycinase
VILVDGREIKDTNLTAIEMGSPISIEHLVVHVMSMNTHYDLHHRKLQINSKEKVS